MSRIAELLKKIRINPQTEEGVAQWETTDLLGDHHQANIIWSANSLTIEQTVKSALTQEEQQNRFVSWSISESGRLLLKEHKGFPEEVSGSLAILNFIKQQLEAGASPTIKQDTIVKGPKV